LATADELVNDSLGCVGEVTKLGFPANQRIGVGNRITNFKT
jgi:hypothetical protein